MNFQALLCEYQDAVVGSAILGEVRHACSSQVLEYPPNVYAPIHTWDDEAVEELVQDVVVDRLLGGGQLAYLFDVASSLSTWRALLTRQVKITLAHRRVRMVIDNLLDRAKCHLGRAETVETIIGPRGKVYRHLGTANPYRPLSGQEVRQVAEQVRLVPRHPPGFGDRTPMVYTGVGLEAVIDIVLRSAPGGIAIPDLGKVMETAFMDWVPSVLEQEETAKETTAVSLEQSKIVGIETIASNFLSSLSAAEVRILEGQLVGLPDLEVERSVGESPLAFIKLRRVIMDRLQTVMEGLDIISQEMMIDSLALSLAAGGKVEDGSDTWWLQH